MTRMTPTPAPESKTAADHEADMFFATIRVEQLTDWEYRLARFHRLLGYQEIQTGRTFRFATDEENGA